MRIEKRTSNAKSLVRSAMELIELARKEGEMTQEEHSMLKEDLVDAKHCLYKAEDKCLRTMRRRSYREHAVFCMIRARTNLQRDDQSHKAQYMLYEAIANMIA